TATELGSLNLPIVLEWVDTPERVERLLPEIAGMVGHGAIVVERVSVVKYTHRGLRQIAADRTVGDVMTPDPASVTAAASIGELVRLLYRRNYRALPVTDDRGVVVGIVSNSDLIERAGFELRAELLPGLAPAALDRALDRVHATGMTAADIMTRGVVTVRPETNLRSTARLMVESRLKRLPVVDAEGKLLGIVARIDILRTVANGSGRAMPGDADESDGVSSVPATARGAMTRGVPLVRADAPLNDVLNAIIATRLNKAVVVDDQRRPLGTISDAELLSRIAPVQQPGIIEVLMRRLPFLRLSPEERAALRTQTGTRAGDLMTAPAVSVSASAPITDAIRRMVEHNHKILPVVDEGGRVVGMLDRADVLRAIAAE
ncbi:MAG TPA: DUF190 domain-containing protein, partial [Thermomicrobiales bacterium]|nr:DUF190 domain-containing protein [Thermomicrobiales bacterium]